MLVEVPELNETVKQMQKQCSGSTQQCTVLAFMFIEYKGNITEKTENYYSQSAALLVHFTCESEC